MRVADGCARGSPGRRVAARAGVGGAVCRRRGGVGGDSQHDAVVRFLAALSSAEEGRPSGILEDLANTFA